MSRRSKLCATAGANDEADFGVAFRAVACEAEQTGQEWASASLAELLETAGEPVIDGDPPPRWRHEKTAGNVHTRFLMGKEALEPESVVHRNVQNTTDSRRSVEIDGLICDPLEEVAPQPVADER